MKMNKRFVAAILSCFVLCVALQLTAFAEKIDRPRLLGVTKYDSDKAYNGYTLFAPLSGKDIWLIDMKGQIVHRWPLPGFPGCYAQLLDNGNLLYGFQTDPNEKKKAGLPETSGQGGMLREITWDGNIVWEYKDIWMHHDFYRMKNGNTLVTRYVEVPFEIMINIKGGVPGTEDNGKMWGDQIDEISPEGKVVWSWKAHEHLDPVKDAIGPLDWRKEWTHSNALFELENGDILTSFRNIDLVCIIDKKTGDIKWRYGQKPGTVAHQHNPHILPNGNMMIFDNGMNRAIMEVSYSRAIELDMETKEVKWEYKSPVITDFYSAACGSAQRLANGNTLICDTLKGRFFEVTKEGEMVWEYTSPFFAPYSFFGNLNWVFKCYRIGADDSRLAGKELNPEKYADVNKLYGPK